MNQLIEKAKKFATEAHKNHTEDDTIKTPYIFHLQRVARLVQLSGGSNIEIASAWLHDTIEDTETNLEDIKREFGDEIAEIVNGLTDLPEWDELSTIDKKLAQAERISKENDSVKRVKLADQISGGELDARNTLIDLKKRKEKLEGVMKVIKVCSGISEGLDKLAEEMYMEVKWFLKNS